MCYGCWEEAGCPSIINDKVKKAAKLIKELYETEDGSVGGYGHSVFDDWNVEGNFKFHFDWIKTNEIEGKDCSMCEETRSASFKALKYFKILTVPERYSALALADGFIK